VSGADPTQGAGSKRRRGVRPPQGTSRLSLPKEGSGSAPPAENGRKKAGRPKAIDWREAERLAEKGVDGPDILAALDVPKALQSKPEFQDRFGRMLEKGHALHRIAVARRLEREGIRRGKPHSLLALARNRLKFDQQQANEKEGLALLAAVIGARERLTMEIEKILRNRGGQVGGNLDGHPA
jgi:hypothetical protein